MIGLPVVSLILVVRNERNFIEKSLQSLLNQTYEKKKTEFIFVDGMSTDGTREYLIDKTEELEKSGFKVIFLNNPQKILATGWNIAIRNATGDIVCRIDAHSMIDKEYVKIGVKELLDHKKNNKIAGLGGVLEHIGEGYIARTISYLFSSKFGVGNSPFRCNSKSSSYTDTAVFALYWKNVFYDVGLFDERLKRNQDIALHKKMIAASYQFITNPEMKIKYFVRSTIWKLLKKAFGDGLWVIRSGQSYLRHKIPLFFVFYIVILCVNHLLPSMVFFPLDSYVIDFPLAIYIALSSFFSIKDSSFLYSPFLFFLYPLFHISYGIGSLWGIFLTNFNLKQ